MATRRRRLPRLRVFLSYHHGDRNLAGRIREELEKLGLAVFVAHDVIDPSHEWQEDILRELRKCPLFMPLLTNRFHRSNWTDQETGMAIAYGKVVVPLRVDRNPYGFAGRIQAFRFSRRLPKRSCLRLFRTIQTHRGLRARVLNSLIHAFGDSPSFDDARDKSNLLLECGPMTRAQVNEVVRVSARNSQIYNSWAASKNLTRFIRRNRKSVEPTLLKEYKEAGSQSSMKK